jgi:signal transduction histidine kinase
MDGERLSILVVDDDEVDRMAVRRALRAAGVGAAVTEAEDVESALAALRRGGFDCVLLDFQLPGGDGRGVLREARAEGIGTPVVMLTGQEDAQTAVELIQAGAADYLAKSALTPERLERSIRHAIRVHRAEMQTRQAEAARERALRVRDRFYAAMSHELRTPINAILGYNDLLLAGVYGPLRPEQELGLERSQRAARHLLELVNDVLDLSKLEAGKTEVQVEEVDVPALVEELFVTVRPLAGERGSELRVTCGGETVPPVRTDPRRLRQILLNLLSNAIKFGRGEPIVVRCAERREGGVAVEVVDRGEGIAAADIPRIFDEFVQLPGAVPGGTGLGLAISLRLARVLGGALEVDSVPGAGSTFRLLLPAAAPEGGEQPEPRLDGAAFA